jgi:hypothetical protein
MIMEQFFQGIGLTEWTNIVMNHYPEASDCMKDNFVECKKGNQQILSNHGASYHARNGGKVLPLITEEAQT